MFIVHLARPDHTMPAVLSTLNAPKGPRHSKPYTRQDKIKGRIFWFVPTVNPIALSYQERITVSHHTVSAGLAEH